MQFVKSIIGKYLLLGLFVMALFFAMMGGSYWQTSHMAADMTRGNITGGLQQDILALILFVEQGLFDKGPSRERFVELLVHERLPVIDNDLRRLVDGDPQAGLPSLADGHHHELLLSYNRIKADWDQRIRPLFLESAEFFQGNSRPDDPAVFGEYLQTLDGEVVEYLFNFGTFSSLLLTNYREKLEHYQRMWFFSLGGMLLIFLMVALLVRRKLVAPIKQLAAATDAIAGGDVHARVAVVGEDELARLATNFNKMATVIGRSLADNALMIGGLKSLNQASNLVLSSLQVEELLQEFAEEAGSLVRARYAVVFILADSGGYEHFVTTGLDPAEFEAIKGQCGMPRGVGVLGHLLHGDTPIRIDDVSTHPSSAGFPAGHPKIRSFLGIPVRLEGRTLGAICLTDKAEGQPFSERDEEMIVSLANAAALAIKNARLLQETLNANEELDVLNRIAAATRRTLQLEELLGYILDELLRLSAFRLLKKGAVFLVDRQEQVLNLIVERNFNKELLSLCSRVEFGRCLCGLAAAENKVVECSRCMEDSRHVTIFAGIEEHGHIILPLAPAGRVLGVLCLYLPPYTELTEREQGLFRSIADIIGMALQNALSYQEVEHTVRERTAELEKTTIELHKLFNAVEQAVETVVITDLEGIIEYVNPAFARVSGYSREEALGQNPRILASGKNPPAMFEEMWETIRAGHIWQGTVINKKKSGEFYSEEMTVTPVKDEAGAIVNFIAINNDVTDRVRAEEELRARNIELAAAKEAAEAADRAKSEFMANMSHELRTPLNAIIGFSDIMGKGVAGELNPQQREYLGDINTSGRHLLELINSILDLSKIEAGRIDLQYDDVEIRQLVEESLLFVRQKAMKHGLEIAVEIDGEVHTVEGDRFRLKQLLVNLLSNAVSHTPDQGRIVVRAKIVEECPCATAEGSCTPAELLELRVEDSGPGIRPEDMGRLFTPFTQLESHLTKEYRGTGLGLTICKRIAEAHEGRIWVESELGRGSSFIVRIPRSRPAISDKALARRLSRASAVDPETGIPTWKSFLANCRQACVYHCRTDQSFGIMRIQCHCEERQDDHLDVIKVLVQEVREYEILTHGERPGCYYVILLASDRRKVEGAGKRFLRVARDNGWQCAITSVVYPEDGETAGCLLDMLDKS